MADQYDGQWEKLDNDKKKEILGKLKGLEELRDYIDLIRESYTRLLKVNGVNNDGTWIEKEPEKLIRLEDIEEQAEQSAPLVEDVKVIDFDTGSPPSSPSPRHASP